MNHIDDILSKAESLSKQTLTCAEAHDLSEAKQLLEEYDCVVITASVLCVSIKNIPFITKTQGKRAAALCHKQFDNVLQSFAKATDGQLIDLSSSCFMMVYPATHEHIDAHVRNAMKLSHILGKVATKQIPSLANINFSIGVDHGRILCTKGNSGVVWYGTCIDKAIAIGDLCQKPAYLGISGLMYSILEEDTKTHTRHILGIPKKEPAWQRYSFQFENEHKHYYSTIHTIESI